MTIEKRNIGKDPNKHWYDDNKKEKEELKVKGFTLIELLAVIVILAIITLIAIPIILNIVNSTSVNAAKRNVENYIDAVELYLVRSEMDESKLTLERNNKYNVNNSTVINDKTYLPINDLVEISGSKPTGKEDYIILNGKGKVTDAKLTTLGYLVEIENGKIKETIKGTEIKLESITLNYTEETMEKGSTFKLIPTFNPKDASNQEVIYESSDTSIVTVDENGIVTAVNPGTSKVTVTSKENKNIKAECNITVVISATGLILTPIAKEIKEGEAFQLIGTIEPNSATTNSLSWKSSNGDVAVVDNNGLVTGVSAGEAIITATTVNGIEAISTITVIEVDTSNASIPNLVDGLVPVVYENNTWKIANTTKLWYNYSKQRWANAVVLKSGITKGVGDSIDVSMEVQGMFVWIPKYEYKIDGRYGTHSDGTAGTITTPGEIKVNFISKTKTTATSGYIIHPAFNFGGSNVSGIWVGKFETSVDRNSACYTSPSDTNCNNKNQTPYIIPNVNSARYQNVSNQFVTAQKFNSYLSSSIDSHMIKNSEWGAVVYLSQSKYGKYGNNNYIGLNKEVMLNNCSKIITGIGADAHNSTSSTTTCTTNTYETKKGQAASTTGNIYGIYDMSGGIYEYVMGVYNNSINSGGFTSIDQKYYDNYTSVTASTGCNGEVCFGHALTETNSWYQDAALFATTEIPWIVRGGSYSDQQYAGIFSYDHVNGNTTGYVTFRIALS